MSTKEKLLLLILLSIGFFFRTFAIDWDQGYNFHPDERAIIMTVGNISLPPSLDSFFSPESPLNPKFFAYGNMPFYLLKLTTTSLAPIWPEATNYENIGVIGRFIVALLEIGTMLLLFFLAKKIWNNHIGFIAVSIYALSVFPIQVSHFYTVDPFITFFAILTIFNIVRFHDKKTFARAFLIGMSFGLALASKISALPIIVPIATYFLLISIKYILEPSSHKKMRSQVLRLVGYGATITVATGIFWALTQPYVVIDFERFLQQTKEQSQMTNDAFTFPYTLQYVGKIPYIYELKNIFLWGLGPVIGAYSVIGLWIYGKSLSHKKRRIEKIVILSFVIVFFLIIGRFAVGWMRYTLPLYPYFALFAALFLDFVFSKIEKKKVLYPVCCVIVSLLIAAWPVSFLSVYLLPHTRLAATDWILQNIPPGSTVAVEHWDDRVPVHGGEIYTFQELPLYETDTPEKWHTISHMLSQSDYIVISSNRLYTPLQKLTDCESLPPGKCYPETANYYKDLFNNKSNFNKEKEFAVYPTIPIINIPINDSGADESFTVYDHPKIMIFKKE